jgi:hypothetical protein
MLALRGMSFLPRLHGLSIEFQRTTDARIVVSKPESHASACS